jgi:hypothetical protein
MIAIAVWVKLVAVPRPPPGPWDARTGLTDSSAMPADAAAIAKREVRCLFRDDAMAISCDDALQKIRRTAYSGFEDSS